MCGVQIRLVCVPPAPAIYHPFNQLPTLLPPSSLPAAIIPSRHTPVRPSLASSPTSIFYLFHPPLTLPLNYFPSAIPKPSPPSTYHPSTFLSYPHTPVRLSLAAFLTPSSTSPALSQPFLSATLHPALNSLSRHRTLPHTPEFSPPAARNPSHHPSSHSTSSSTQHCLVHCGHVPRRVTWVSLLPLSPRTPGK